MELCADCDKIDFHAAGLHAPGDPDYNFFSLDDVPLLDVMARQDECFLCGIVTRTFTEWEQAAYGGFGRLRLEEARVSFAAERTKTLHEIEDNELREINESDEDGDKGEVNNDNNDNDGNNDDGDRDESPMDFPSLFRISVSYTVRDPEGNGWIGPNAVFQKCATEVNNVASIFNNNGSNEWPDHKEPYLGRIRPLVADCRLFRRWKDYCISSHGTKCWAPFNGPTAFRIRLIEVKQECVVELTEKAEWVALSYLWGKSKNLTLKKESLDQFKTPGFLSRDRVPKTIYDAMILADAIGEKYLWVDSICIVQDDDLEKMEFIPRMDAIYRHSILTIIDAAGSDSQSGLPGMHDGTRTQVQTPFTIKGVTLVRTVDPININSVGYLAESNWNTRGWTFQEGMLSPRALIFTKEQVYWQCSQASWCEDGFWECPNSPTIYRHGLVDELRNIWSSNPNLVEKRYRQLVEIYSQRKLSYESDGLDAFKGILESLKQISGLEFLWGLPTFYLGAALTWPAHDEAIQVRRRTGLCKYSDSSGNIFECPFPSWSWVGWVGKIHFEEVFGTLTSRHASLVFHKIHPDGATEIIQQNSEFKEKYASRRWNKEEPDIPKPDWRDESKTMITRSDVPVSVFSRNVSTIVLGFWSSTAVVTVQYKHDGRDWDFDIKNKDPKVLQNEVEFRAQWGQIPRHPIEMESELVRFIIIGRCTLSAARAKEELIAIMADLETDEGLTYRRAIVSIRESEWNKLEGKVWNRIFLA